MKRLVLLIISLLFISNISAQSIDEILDKIDLKLSKDKKYLNLYYISFSPNEVKDTLLYWLPKPDDRKAFHMDFSDGVDYRLVFLKEGIGIDSMVVLYLSKIKRDVSEQAEFFAGGAQAQVDTTIEYLFSDLYYLKNSYPHKYIAIYNFLYEYIGNAGVESIQSLLGINPDKNVKTVLGISSRDNLDYLDFARANFNHWYPYPKVKTAAFSRGGGSNFPFRVDASLSSFTFSYSPWMDFNFGGGASIEFTTEDKLLNILPYEGMNFAGIARILLELDGEKGINKALYIDARVGVKIKAKTNEILSQVPVFMTDPPKLNTVTSFLVDLNVTRPFSLPFMNLYLNVGSRNFDNPYAIVDVNGQRKSFFTFNQFAYTMSFFWNTSDKRTSRFRMDIGFGFHDVWQQNYNAAGNPTNTELLQEKFSPIVALNFNFAARGKPLFGVGIRSYDSRPKITGWFRIVEISDRHSVRAEVMYLAPPIARKIRPWENENGVLVQVRYRLGV